MSKLETLLKQFGVTNAEDLAKDFEKADINSVQTEILGVLKTRVLNSEDESFKSIKNEIHKSAYGRLQDEAKNKIASTFGIAKGEYDGAISYEDLLKLGKERIETKHKATEVNAQSKDETLKTIESEKLNLLKQFDEYKSQSVSKQEYENLAKEVSFIKKDNKLIDIFKELKGLPNTPQVRKVLLETIENKYTVAFEGDAIDIRQKDGRQVLDKEQRNILGFMDILKNEATEIGFLPKAQPQPTTTPQTITTQQTAKPNMSIAEQWRNWTPPVIKK